MVIERRHDGEKLALLVDIVDRLLGPGGCPWDQEQTHESLKRHLLEEVYELFEAIDSGDPERLQEELGDLLLQPLMHAQMEARDGNFSINEVAEAISDKLVRRHPHVFGDVDAPTAEEVLKNWDRIKQSERKEEESKSVLSGIPRTMPALLRAYEVSKRAARVGFEWTEHEDVFAKLDEEVNELKQAIRTGNHENVESEIGDLLFTAVNLARWSKVEPEEALRKMLHRFTDRFMAMEALAEKPLGDLGPEEWDSLWNEAKKAGNR